MLKFKIACLLVLCAFLSGRAQHAQRADSLKSRLSGELADTSRIRTTHLLVGTLNRLGKYKEANEWAKKNLDFALSKGMKQSLGGIYTDLALVADRLSDYPASLRYDKLSLASYLEFNDKKGAAACYNNIGIIYYNFADYTKCLEYFQKSLKMQEELRNRYAIAATIGNIAVIYELLKEDSLSMIYQQKSYDMHKEMGDRSDMGFSLGNLGNLYRRKKDYAKAEELYRQSLAIFTELGEKQGLVENYSYLGSLYFEKGNVDEAIAVFMKSKELAEELGNKKNLSGIYTLLAAAYEKKNDLATAIGYYGKAFEVSKSAGNLSEEKEAADGLYQCYNKRSDARNALYYHVIARRLNDSIFNASKNESFNSLKTQFALDRQELELNARAEQDRKKQEEEKAKQRMVIYAVIGILLVVVIFSYFLYKRFRLTREQNKVIELQKLMVEQKNKEITDSIVYAKRLQQAIIPPAELVKHYFPESFIYFKPKDIIAGDFYWMEVIGGQDEDSGMQLAGDNKPAVGGKRLAQEAILIAVADCTGHGVPGALVSVVCSNALNRAVKEFRLTEPGKILDKTRELVLETFARSGEDIKDGMDISMACILRTPAGKTTVQWSGANNPLWYLDRNEIREIKPDKQPIGWTDRPRPYSTHTLTLERGSSIFLFTDGFADQFGGADGKKFKYKQLQQLFVSISHLDPAKQAEAVERAFSGWKGDHEQVDDVCVIGIRL